MLDGHPDRLALAILKHTWITGDAAGRAICTLHLVHKGQVVRITDQAGHIRGRSALTPV